MKLFELTLEGYKFNRKLKNIILKLISWFMGLMLLYAMMAVDYEDNFYSCMVMIVISMCWLVPYGIVNDVIEL